MPTIIATPAASNANSYTTAAEALVYFDERLPLPTPWEDADSQERLLIMATRTMDSLAQATKRLVTPSGGEPYYLVGRKWTGVPSTTTQRLAWPRTGMYDRNGNAIASGEIPYLLKDATSELAGQLGIADRTLDNDVITQGLKSLGVGSVSLAFKDTFAPQVIPDAVLNMLPPSWYTEETIESMGSVEFDVV